MARTKQTSRKLTRPRVTRLLFERQRVGKISVAPRREIKNKTHEKSNGHKHRATLSLRRQIRQADQAERKEGVAVIAINTVHKRLMKIYLKKCKDANAALYFPQARDYLNTCAYRLAIKWKTNPKVFEHVCIAGSDAVNGTFGSDFVMNAGPQGGCRAAKERTKCTQGTYRDSSAVIVRVYDNPPETLAQGGAKSSSLVGHVLCVHYAP